MSGVKKKKPVPSSANGEAVNLIDSSDSDGHDSDDPHTYAHKSTPPVTKTTTQPTKKVGKNKKEQTTTTSPATAAAAASEEPMDAAEEVDGDEDVSDSSDSEEEVSEPPTKKSKKSAQSTPAVTKSHQTHQSKKKRTPGTGRAGTERVITSLEDMNLSSDSDSDSDDEDDEDEDEDDQSNADMVDGCDEATGSVGHKRGRKLVGKKKGGPKSGRTKKVKQPPPTIVDGCETWSVNCIMAEDFDEGENCVVYLIKEPIGSIQACRHALKVWRTEKNAIRAAAKESDLIPTAPATSLGLGYPIYHRQKKTKLKGRSFKTDQDWMNKQIEKQAKLEQKAKDRARKEAIRQKLRERELAAQEKRLGLLAKLKEEEELKVKETAAEKRKREEKEKAEAERIKEMNRLARERELACTEPYYYVVADDTLLMTCMDSDEEEEWGVGALKKMKPEVPQTRPKPKGRFTPRTIPPIDPQTMKDMLNGQFTRQPDTTSATNTAPTPTAPAAVEAKSVGLSRGATKKSMKDKTRGRASQRPISPGSPIDLTADSTSPVNVEPDFDSVDLPGDVNTKEAKNTMAISHEEFSSDDEEMLGDGRGEDRKYRLYVHQNDVEEVSDILDIRELTPESIRPLGCSPHDRYEYLVKWKPSVGRPHSWESESFLKGAQLKIQSFITKKRSQGWNPLQEKSDKDEEEVVEEEEERMSTIKKDQSDHKSAIKPTTHASTGTATKATKS